MFSRRYLRRTLITSLLIPVLLITLVLFYYNGSSASSPSDETSHHHDHFDVKQSQTSAQIVMKINRHDEESMVKSVLLNRQVESDAMLDNNRPFVPFNPVQPIASSNQHSNFLPVIQTKSLERFVHLDLKGAAPKIDYYRTLFPYLKRLGATGLLIEYEDMFPYTGHLSIVQHGLAYTSTDVQQILKLAEENNLKVMPLLQVYGHLEYVLKLKEFMHLREDQRYPQVITPCLEESYTLIFGKMINKYLSFC